jgi:hypothetical protein
LHLISQRSVSVVHLVTGERRKESADYPHTSFCLNAVAVTVVMLGLVAVVELVQVAPRLVLLIL